VTDARRGFKADGIARAELGGALFDAVPKSAWALIARYLAEICTAEPDNRGNILARIMEEADCLALNGIIPERHAKAMRAALAKAKGGKV